MSRPPSPRRSPRPLDHATLELLALRYVGKYATTRAKLLGYLNRKIGERGWTEETPPRAEAIVTRFTELGYVNDRQFAEQRSAALTRRGYGGRRVDAALRASGIGEEDRIEAGQAAQSQAWEAALAMAKRKRIGPFGPETIDRSQRDRAIATLIRAGHDFAVARKVVDLRENDVKEQE